MEIPVRRWQRHRPCTGIAWLKQSRLDGEPEAANALVEFSLSHHAAAFDMRQIVEIRHFAGVLATRD
jgi:hypothetical protein